MEFDIGKWLGKIVLVPGNYRSLYEFAESEQHLEAHTHSRAVVPNSDGIRTVGDLDEFTRERVVATYTSSVKKALETFSGQMIVLAVAFVEGMTQEFVEALFKRHPERMHSFLSTGGKQGLVSFKTIIDSGSKEEIVGILAKDSSNILLQGKFEKNLDRVEEISKSSLPEELKRELIALAKDRNRIVHEAHTPSTEKDDVKSAFDRLDELLRWYGSVALDQGVPINDPAGLISA